MRIDGDRLWTTVEQFAAIGATGDGGVRRVALTDPDVEARTLLSELAREIGCSERVDAVGNAFYRLEGADSGRPAVMLGSHLDSQPSGGRFDGALGVLAGLEVLRTVAEAGRRTVAPLELANWSDEEGARFDVSCIGSSVYSGALALADAYALTDGDGVTLRAALDAAGLVGSAALGEPLPSAYLELHIEQGPLLEAEGLAIGVVEGIFGISWEAVRIVGASGHAGTTPSVGRRDALLAAAGLVRAVDGIAGRHGSDARGTVCSISARPNAGSVMIGEVELLVDLRHRDGHRLAAMESELAGALADLRGHGFETSASTAWRQDPVVFDPACVSAVAEAARELGHAGLRMFSGAGHDAGYVARVAPTGMVFVPCAGGVSHNPRESVAATDAEAGAAVLLAAALRLAGVA